jgi:NADPH-dependent 2,4-dienoyl-CoA reductase/sulfur reductase-like enzyme
MVHDVAVVGGGPAGLAAAAAAAGAGCRVTLLDSGSRVGGQYWRHPPTGPDVDLHHDLSTFDRLAGALGAVEVLTGHEVWTVQRNDPGFVIRTTCGTALTARCLVLAPGAYDRQLPFPGWDLPGVMTAGGVQALLKGHGVLAGRRVVVAGTGPFLLAVAAGLAGRGADVAGVYDANPRRRWLREPVALARNAGKLAEAAAYAAMLARRRIKVRTGRAVIAAHGGAAVEAVTVARLDSDWRVITGSEERVAADVLAVGWGFTPQLELALAVGCPTQVGVDGSLVVRVDDRQRAAQGVYVAGEATGIGGAALAVVEGEIAGRAAAAALSYEGAAEPGRSASLPRALIRRRDRLRAFAAAMHRAHPVRDGWRTWLRADTVVCRCEEVGWASVQDAVHNLGATDPRTAKLLARTGMGWCQGRVCGYAVARLVAAEAGTPYDPRAFAERPVAAPVRLGTLAADQADDQADDDDEDGPSQ